MERMQASSGSNDDSQNVYYEEVFVDGRIKFQCLICKRTLSRKQRVEDHLKAIHYIDNSRTRKYKRYLDNPSLKIPKQTRYNQKVRANNNTDSIPHYNETRSFDFEMFLPETTESSVEKDTFVCAPSANNDNEFELETSTEMVLPSAENYTGVVSYSSSDSSLDSSDDNSSGFESLSSDSDLSETEESKEIPGLSAHESTSMALLSFIARHRITNEGSKDLIDLIKVSCPENEVFKTLTLKSMHSVCGNCSIKTFDVCEKCLGLFNTDNSQDWICSTPGCGGYRYRGTLEEQRKKIPKCSFYTINIDDQLKELLERDKIWKTIQDRICMRGKDVIEDILDGKFYKKLCEKDGFLNCTNNISLIFNTDGAPLYSSSSISLWPVFLAVNELPSPDRFSKQNMLMWGIWQGKGKPPFNTYFEPFAHEMTCLYEKGIKVQVKSSPGELITVKAAVILGTTDLQGKAYLLNMTQHNGENGCSSCEETGCVVKQGKGHTRCYPYKSSNRVPTKRTTTSFLQNGVNAHNSNKKFVCGVQDVTSLALMPWFDIVLGMVPDYMHGALLGVTKTLLNKWFSPKNSKQPYFIGSKIGKVTKRLLKMKPPGFIARLPRNLEKHFKNFKASELQSWLLYYSIPCLLGFLPDNYLEHFAHFSEGIFILLGDAITEESLCRAKSLLDKFYRDFQGLYGDGSCGLNVHNIGAHLADYVEGWGPLWAWSNFGFEDMNGTILEYAHGTGNVCRQLLWMLHAQSRLRNNVITMQDGGLKDFVSRMVNSKRGIKKLQQCQGCCIAGGLSNLGNINEDLMLKIESMENGPRNMVLRIVRNNQVICSKAWTRMRQRNSSVVILNNGTVAEIQYFIFYLKTKKVLVVFKEIEIDRDNAFHLKDAGYHIIRTSKAPRLEHQVCRVEDINELGIYLEGNEDCHFIARAPNFCGVCG